MFIRAEKKVLLDAISPCLCATASRSANAALACLYFKTDKENGLVHISQLCRDFVSDPTTVVSIHQHVQVKVVSIDRERKRIGLTMILD